jgi:hypothetical protein
MFMVSFNATIDDYRTLLASVAAGRLELPNDNMDIGGPMAAGKYKGADQAYDKLLGKLADRHFEGISSDLRANVLDYYKDRKAPASPPSKKKNADWMKQVEQLNQLPTEVATAP